MCVQLDVPLVVFHHDPPPARWVSTLRAAGIRVWMQASSPEIASAAIELGVDGIVAQGSEAGGHARGRIPLHALLRTIRHKWPDMLVLGAGGISDGTARSRCLVCGRRRSLGRHRLGRRRGSQRPSRSTSVDSSIHPVGHCAALHSDPSGPTSHTGFSPPPQCSARRQAFAVPIRKSTGRSAERDCFRTRQTCLMTCRSGQRCRPRPKPAVIGNRWSTRPVKGLAPLEAPRLPQTSSGR